MTNIERLQWYKELSEKCEYFEKCSAKDALKANKRGEYSLELHYQKVTLKWQKMRKFINQRMLTLTEKIWEDLKTESEKLQNF